MKKKFYLFLVSVMLWGFTPLSVLAEDVVRVQHTLGSVVRDGGTVSFDNTPTEGNLLVVLSGHRSGENDPAIADGTGWTRHIVKSTTPNNRTIAMWSKVAEHDDQDVTINWNGYDGERDAWVILQEFSGVENWQFFDVAFAEAEAAGNELTIGPTAIPASGKVLAIAATVFRGDVDNPAYTDQDMEGVIHYAYNEPQDANQLVHGATAFASSQNGNIAWETKATWDNERFATGILAVFTFGSIEIEQVQYKFESVPRDGGIVSYDTSPIEGNLLVVLSGHRAGENDPAITDGTGWTRHIVKSTIPNNRTIAMWSKVAEDDDQDVTINWNGYDGERDAWVILQEFTGAEEWQFFDVVSSEAAAEGTDLYIGPTKIPGSGKVLAITGTVFRGDIENPDYTSQDMDSVIHYAYTEPQNPAQVVHGSVGFTYSLNGNFAWETTASWDNERFATGILALFYIGDIPVIETYTLTVTNGSGSGEYEEGEVVSIIADPAPDGKQFAAWTGDVASVADVNIPSTTITMPAANAAITATYEDANSSKSLTEKQIISLYPNPVQNGQFNVVLANPGLALAQIYDVTGRLALTTQIQQGPNTISADGLPNGLYILRVSSSHEVNSLRFIIER